MRHTTFLVVSFMLMLAPLAGQTVTVTSPNGGESWPQNSTRTIAWNFTNAGSATVNITLRNSAGKVGDIKTGCALSAGSWEWKIVGKLENGTEVAPGTDYKVRINIVGYNTRDDSDSDFAIAAAGGPAPTLQLLSPNGGESWPSGSMRNITWAAANWTGTVRLELWQNGGKKGKIAEGIASAPGTHPWPVGTLKEGANGHGAGYTVRVVREYKGGPRSPVPVAPLMDESDGSFSIAFPKMTDSKIDVQPIKVSSPKEGEIFTYGPYAGPNTYGISLPIHWETPHALPFRVELYDTGGNKQEELIEITSDVQVQRTPNTDIYFTTFLFVPENSAPGWYKIRVRTSDGRHSGFSGKFRIREVKVLEETIAAGIDNHDHWKFIDYSFGTLFSGGKKTQFQNLPARARVGFSNRYQTASAGQYAYLGYVFRSQLTIDLKRFTNLKGIFLNADLYLERKEHHNNYQNGINLCGDKLYVLSGPWGKGNVMETPGVLLQTLSQSYIGQHIDVTGWFNAWLSGQSPNYGLLLTAVSESFNHVNNWCVSYFHAVFNIRFQTEE